MSTVASGNSRSARRVEARYVKFKYGNTRYTVSPEKKKVYNEWVEVETSRAADILTAFRSENNS